MGVLWSLRVWLDQQMPVLKSLGSTKRAQCSPFAKMCLIEQFESAGLGMFTHLPREALTRSETFSICTVIHVLPTISPITNILIL